MEGRQTLIDPYAKAPPTSEVIFRPVFRQRYESASGECAGPVEIKPLARMCSCVALMMQSTGQTLALVEWKARGALVHSNAKAPSTIKAIPNANAQT